MTKENILNHGEQKLCDTLESRLPVILEICLLVHA